jgi:hypothetical protein
MGYTLVRGAVVESSRLIGETQLGSQLQRNESPIANR